MTHEGLEAIRVSFARIMKTFPKSNDYGPIARLVLGVGPLLGYIDELHGVVHDLRQEPGWELGRQEERREVLEMIELARSKSFVDRPPHYGAALHAVLDDLWLHVYTRGSVAPHLAPDDLRRENEALRAALKGLLSGPSPIHKDVEDRLLIVPQHCLDTALRLLGDVYRLR